MCVYGHSWPLSFSADMIDLDKMSDDTKPLWIEIEDLEGNSPVYLASPCKADLTVRKTKCQCKEYFDSETVYSNIVIQPTILHEGVDWYGDSDETLLEPYTVRVKFPKDKDKDEFVLEFKFHGEVKFTYMPEDSTPDEWKEMTLKDGDDVNDPIMLEQALRSMDKEDLADWIVSNSEIREANLNQYVQNDYRLEVVDRYENNYGQNTVYKSCVKKNWWALFDHSKDVECIKIKADGYSDYKPNFCYERKWDKASQAEVGLIAGEVALGVAVGIFASPSGPGAIAAYCGTTTAVSAAGAWLLAGTMAGDKWPNGIIDQ